uniref:Uncharacterized protein n=1 Tax=Mycena chlorophos TaxID=658473 RepID=A0ABQ0L6G4_MYCCL|nr:predicted protein [Mycena chlorophos]
MLAARSWTSFPGPPAPVCTGMQEKSTRLAGGWHAKHCVLVYNRLRVRSLHTYPDPRQNREELISRTGALAVISQRSRARCDAHPQFLFEAQSSLNTPGCRIGSLLSIRSNSCNSGCPQASATSAIRVTWSGRTRLVRLVANAHTMPHRRIRHHDANTRVYIASKQARRMQRDAGCG